MQPETLWSKSSGCLPTAHWTSQRWRNIHAKKDDGGNDLRQKSCAKNQMTVLYQPSHPPDLSPRDFFLFLKLKSLLRGRRFDTIDDMKTNPSKALAKINFGYFLVHLRWHSRFHSCTFKLYPTEGRACMSKSFRHTRTTVTSEETRTLRHSILNYSLASALRLPKLQLICRVNAWTKSMGEINQTDTSRPT